LEKFLIRKKSFHIGFSLISFGGLKKTTEVL
jgi:hypothetical protein